MKKYKLLDEYVLINGIKLYRIYYLDSKELGGYIQSESNLNQEGECKVVENARVYGNAWVSGNAKVSGNAQVSGNAWVCGYARVYGNASVYGNARVSGNAKVDGNAQIAHASQVFNLSNLKYNITVTKQQISIGCLTLSEKDWRKRYKAIARKENISGKELQHIKQFCEYALKAVKYYQ